MESNKNLAGQLLLVADSIRKDYPMQSALVLHASDIIMSRDWETHWIIQANKALEKEISEKIIGSQAAAKVYNFLSRHSRKTA
jgi:hypothetical protein